MTTKACKTAESRRALPQRIRSEALTEVERRCACDPVRHLDVISAGGVRLEVHHIVPYRVVRSHSIENLIALCPNCHSRADTGAISAWTLRQMKRVVMLRRLESHQRLKETVRLLREYRRSPRNRVYGEGYYTACAFFDHAMTQSWKLREMIVAIRDVGGSGTVSPEFILCTLSLEIHNTNLAIRALNQCTTAARKTKKYAFLRGNVFAIRGTHSQAINWYKKASLFGGMTDSLRCNWGDALIYRGIEQRKSTKKFQYFNQALNLFSGPGPKSAPLLFNKGRLLKAMGRLSEARSCFERALQIGPHFPLPHVELAMLCLHEGAPDQALVHFEEALARRPRSLRFLLKAAEVAIANGSKDRARRYLYAYQLEEGPIPEDRVGAFNL